MLLPKIFSSHKLRIITQGWIVSQLWWRVTSPHSLSSNEAYLLLSFTIIRIMSCKSKGETAVLSPHSCSSPRAFYAEL